MYLTRNWQRAFEAEAAVPVTRRDLDMALANIESTYTMRLLATFEAILRDHMQGHNIRLPDGAKWEWLVGKSAGKSRPPVDRVLLERVRNLRLLRNELAHAVTPVGTYRSFTDVLSILSRFLDRLVDPPG